MLLDGMCVIATPQATRWIDAPTLEQLTGHSVRSDYKLPDEADPLPPARCYFGNATHL
ncbi:hypothetical protein [Reticulibacter mediterranei]|uniref:hypothetical protein n=1 Tax=Reticulibacter mediterranei TaxID=2778369 RepID=UPI001C68FB2A|nr:hypothetical protein [Reticulibacter mediterranei]